MNHVHDALHFMTEANEAAENAVESAKKAIEFMKKAADEMTAEVLRGTRIECPKCGNYFQEANDHYLCFVCNTMTKKADYNKLVQEYHS